MEKMGHFREGAVFRETAQSADFMRNLLELREMRAKSARPAEGEISVTYNNNPAADPKCVTYNVSQSTLQGWLQNGCR